MFGLGRKNSDARQQTPPARQYAENVIAVISFQYEGVPMYAQRGVKTGLVTSLSKTKGGELELIVRVEGINLPKRVLDKDVIATLYVNEAAASAAIAALA